MYKHILVAIEHSPADAAIVAHVRQLASLTGARLLLLHVADGWAARAFDDLKLRESEEMRQDRDYLERLAASLRGAGVPAEWRLGRGDPARVIVEFATREGVDLVAMATHGHRLLGDLLRGSTATRVRHDLRIPVLLLRAT